MRLLMPREELRDEIADALSDRNEHVNRWWKPSDRAEALMLALQSECDIRERARHLTHVAHREPWLIGSPDAVQDAIAWARIRHTESIARSRALATVEFW